MRGVVALALGMIAAAGLSLAIGGLIGFVLGVLTGVVLLTVLIGPPR